MIAIKIYLKNKISTTFWTNLDENMVFEGGLSNQIQPEFSGFQWS